MKNDEGKENKGPMMTTYSNLLVKPEDKVNDTDVPKAPSSGVLYRAKL